MASKNPELIVKIGADSSEFDKSMEGLASKAKVAAAAGAVAFAALAAGATASINEFREFEKSFSNAVTLLDEGSFKTKTFAQGVKDMREGLYDLRASSGETFENLNQGLFDLISAGVDAEHAIDVLNTATKLALAGATDTSVAVDGLTSALNAYGLEADQAEVVAAKFFTAQKFGKTTIAELSSEFGKVGATAASFGVSLDEVLAAVSATTLAGIKTNEAFTGLKAAFANIINPSQVAADEAQRLGIVFNSAGLKAVGLQGFLDQITKSAGFNETSLQKLFGSMEALNTILALTGEQSGDFKDILSEQNDTVKTAQTLNDGYATKTDTVDQKVKLLYGSIDSLSASIGERLAPAFGEFLDTAIIGFEELRKSIDGTGGDLNKFLDSVVKLQMGISKGIAANVFGVIDYDGAIDRLGETQDAFDTFVKSNTVVANQEGEKQYDAFSKQLADELALYKAGKETKAAADAEEDQREAERQAKKDQAEAERAEAKAVRDEEQRQEKLKLDQQRFDEDLAILTERIAGTDAIESQFAGLRELRDLQELKKRAKNAKDKESIDKQVAIASQKASDETAQAAIDNLQQVFGEETAIGKAIFVVRKAQAIANTITSTQQAMALARATVPPPAGDILAARYAVLGAVNVGVIAATAIQGVTGAAEGGIVQGGSFGRDTQPFMLARDEIIVPSRLNPLSPNFDQTFGGAGLGLGQNVKVEIGLDENASRILTVKQREDRALGIQR